jgi:hypothetical protein
VPNKTIYVSDGDQPIYQRAQELAGGNLSAAIAGALRRYIDIEEGKLEGFDDTTVRVGLGTGRKVHFIGVLAGELVDSTKPGRALPHLPNSQGKYVLHIGGVPVLGGRCRRQAGRLARLAGHRRHPHGEAQKSRP